MDANGCFIVFSKIGVNACIFYWTRKILKQGVDKVF